MDSAEIANLKLQHEAEMKKIREEYEKTIRDCNETIEKQNAEIEELKKKVAATATSSRQSVEQPGLKENNRNVNRGTAKRTQSKCPPSSTAPSTSGSTVVASPPSMSPQKKKMKTAAQTKKSVQKPAVKNENSTPPTHPQSTSANETSLCNQGTSSFLNKNMHSSVTNNPSSRNLSKDRKKALLPSTSSNSTPLLNSSANETTTSTQSENGAGTSENNVENAAPSVSCYICHKGRLDYHISNLHCASSQTCRIKPGDQYYKRKKLTYCKPCFEKTKFKQTGELTHQNDATEVMLQCEKCRKHFHKVCGFAFTNAKRERCPACQEPSKRKNVESIAMTKMDEYMEKKVNGILWEGDEELAKKHHIFVRTMNYSEVQVPMDEQVPKQYLEDFERVYGKNMVFNARTICAFQKIDGVDVLFFVIFAQEYENVNQKKWAIIDYLDSVPLCQPIEIKGKIFGTLLNCYFAYMGAIGFNHAHFWAKPPKQGDDYIFCVHPETQRFHNQIGLEDWYQDDLKKGIADGMISGFCTAGEKFKSENIHKPTDLIIFKDSIWAIMMDWAEWAINEERPEEDRGKAFDHNDFMTRLRKLVDEHSTDNFYIDLVTQEDGASLRDDKLPHEVMGDREEYLEKCKKNHWEWFDLRLAKYSTAAVINMYFNEMKKKTK